MTIPKQGDWIKVPNAYELAGEGYSGERPMLVKDIDESDNSVYADQCFWEVGEYELCPSPLFQVKEDRPLDIWAGNGELVAMFTTEYKHLLPQVLETLNSQYL